MVLYRYHPHMGTTLRREARNESAVQCATRGKSNKGETEASLKMVAQKMKEQYNCSKKDTPEFKAGDMVLLNMKNLCTTWQIKKLENLHDGPFKVLKKIEASVYTLDILDAWKRVGIHLTFNVKLLNPYHQLQFPSQQALPLPPPEVINDHEEYEVQEVLDSRMRRGMIQYLEKWKGFSDRKSVV